MVMDKENTKIDAPELAWSLFKKTGQITYYCLYKQLKGDLNG